MSGEKPIEDQRAHQRVIVGIVWTAEESRQWRLAVHSQGLGDGEVEQIGDIAQRPCAYESFEDGREVAAKLIGFDGAYLRFTGDVRIEHEHAGNIVESYSDSAIWELMYLGKTRTKP